MSVVFTHGTIEDADRVWRNCLCTQCGTVGVHMPGNEFNPIDFAGGPLLCPECHDGAMWDGVDGDPWSEYHRREAELMRRRDWQPDVANNPTAQLADTNLSGRGAPVSVQVVPLCSDVEQLARVQQLIGRSFGEQR